MVSAWAGYVNAFAAPTRPDTLRLAAVESLRKAGSASLRASHAFDVAASNLLWDAVFRLLQDEDEGVREETAAFVYGCAALLGAAGEDVDGVAAKRVAEVYTIALGTAHDVCVAWMGAGEDAVAFFAGRLERDDARSMHCPSQSDGAVLPWMPSEASVPKDGGTGTSATNATGAEQAMVIFEEEPANMYAEDALDAQYDAWALASIVQSARWVAVVDVENKRRVLDACGRAVTDLSAFVSASARQSTVRYAPCFQAVYRRLCMVWALSSAVDRESTESIASVIVRLQSMRTELHPALLHTADDILAKLRPSNAVGGKEVLHDGAACTQDIRAVAVATGSELFFNAPAVGLGVGFLSRATRLLY
eukprot:Opistho-2@49953